MMKCWTEAGPLATIYASEDTLIVLENITISYKDL